MKDDEIYTEVKYVRVPYVQSCIRHAFTTYMWPSTAVIMPYTIRFYLLRSGITITQMNRD